MDLTIDNMNKTRRTYGKTDIAIIDTVSPFLLLDIQNLLVSI